jgi:thiamine pyrophosphokinase
MNAMIMSTIVMLYFVILSVSGFLCQKIPGLPLRRQSPPSHPLHPKRVADQDDVFAFGGGGDQGDGAFHQLLNPYRGDAYRCVYAVQLADAVWVLHAFQKKSKTGIKTPQQEVDTIHTRLKRLKEELS